MLSSHYKRTVNSYLPLQVRSQLLLSSHYQCTVNSYWLVNTSVQSTPIGWPLPVCSQLLLSSHYQCTVNSLKLAITSVPSTPLNWPLPVYSQQIIILKKNTFYLNILYFVCFIVVAADTVVKQSYKGFILLTVELLKAQSLL